MHKLCLLSFFAALFLFSVFHAYFAIRQRGKTDASKDADSFKLMARIRIVSVVIVIISSFYPVISLPWRRNTDYLIGAVMIAAALILRIYSIRKLGVFFTNVVMVRENQKIVTDGLYKYIRHPSYTGLFLFILGLGVGMGSLIGLVLIAALTFYGFDYRIKVEERVLISSFGSEYGDYMKRTKKLVPFVY